MASGICKSGITGRRQRPKPNISCSISTLKSLSLSTVVPQVYEYLLYYDMLNFIRELCKVFGGLWITGTTGVTVLLCSAKSSCWRNWHVGIRLETRKYFFFACGILFHTKDVPV